MMSSLRGDDTDVSLQKFILNISEGRNEKAASVEERTMSRIILGFDLKDPEERDPSGKVVISKMVLIREIPKKGIRLENWNYQNDESVPWIDFTVEAPDWGSSDR